MGCGCGRNNRNNVRRPVAPVTNIVELPKQVPPVSTSPSPVSMANTGFTASNQVVSRTPLNADRIRVERLRRDAINRAKGN